MGCWWWWWWWGPPSWPEVVSNSTRQASTAASQARWAASRSPDHPLTTGANNFFEVGTFGAYLKGVQSLSYSSCGGQTACFIFCLPLVRNIISYQTDLMKYCCLLFEKQRNDIIMCLKLLVTIISIKMKCKRCDLEVSRGHTELKLST